MNAQAVHQNQAADAETSRVCHCCGREDGRPSFLSESDHGLVCGDAFCLRGTLPLGPVGSLYAFYVRIGDLIQMRTLNDHTWRWGYVTRVERGSTIRMVRFCGETSDGVPLHVVRRARTLVERKGHRSAR